MKRLLTVLVITLFYFSALNAEKVKIDGIYYEIDTNNLTASVSYKGDKSPLTYKNKYDGEIIIPETVRYNDKTYNVTAIGWGAFMKCTTLKNVLIPNSIQLIEESAFSECISLTSIVIPNSVTRIEKYAFEHCSSLVSIILPSKINRIEESTFLDCTHLTSIIIPNGVKSIEDNAFEGCSHIDSVLIPYSVEYIGNSAFYSCSNLTFIIIPNSVKKIGDFAFENCNKLKIYTSSLFNFDNICTSWNQIVQIPSEQLMFLYPFSMYVKAYIEEEINKWQQKGEFERTIDWQKRVNTTTRQEKVQELLAEAEQKYIEHQKLSIIIVPTLGKYDADNEVFAMTDYKFGNIYMAVPLDEAQAFKNNWKSKKLSYQLQIKDDQIKLSSLTIKMPNGKEYTYRNTDAVNYNLAEVEYNFDPIEIDIESKQDKIYGQQKITTTKIKAGISTIDINIPQTETSNPNTFVIIFANEDYKNVASVPFAKNDGAIFQKYCQKTLGVPVSNIHYVENASFNDMRIQLAWLNDVCNAFEGNASLIVYYAGHGIPDEASKSAYLLPVDGDGRYVQSAFKLDDMYQKLGNMNAKSVTVFMDACFSGSKREDGMLASARGVAIKVHSGEPQGNMVVFSAATGDETAYPNNDEQHGMFTYYLLKKLQETKGDVTLQDLGNYITTNVRQQSIVKNGKSQTPCVIPSATLDASWQNWKLK